MAETPMTDPSATRTERKHAAILHAATDEFLDHGYAGANVDRIATRAEVSKPTVYAHFGGKEPLFTEVVTVMTGAAGDQVRTRRPPLPEAGAGPDEVAAYLRASATWLLDVVLTPRLVRLRRLVIGEAERFPVLARAMYDGGPGRSIGDLTDVVDDLTRRGLLAAPDPRTAAVHLNWLVVGQPLNDVTVLGDAAAPAAGARAAHVDEAVRVFLAAYGGDRPGERA